MVPYPSSLPMAPPQAYYALHDHHYADVRVDTLPLNEGPRQADQQHAPLGEALGQQLNASLPLASLGADSLQWTLPQKEYTGNKGQLPAARAPPPCMVVNVSAYDAVRPERLALVLQDPLDPGFPLENGMGSRKGKKLTFRYAVSTF